MPALAVLGGFVGLFALWAFSSLWSGYVLTVLWWWFMVPTFHLPQLSLAAAIGVVMVVRFMTYHVDLEDSKLETSERVIKLGCYAVFVPALTLFFGWIVHAFM